MAQKKITELTLISSITDSVNFVIDNGIQSYRGTAAQIKAYILAASSIATAMIQDAAITTAKILDANVTRDKLAAGAFAKKSIRSVAATGAALVTDDIIELSGATFTLTLYAASGNAGRILELIHAGTTGSQIYTIDGNSSETINGYADWKLYKNGERLRIYCDGTNWKILDKDIKVTEFQNALTAGTNGGVASTSWTQLPLNRQKLDTTFASLTSNIITMQAGIYEFLSYKNFENTNQFLTRIYDIDNSQVLTDINGQNMESMQSYGNTSGNDVTARSMIRGTVKFTVATQIKIEHIAQATGGGIGLGRASSLGSEEIFHHIEIRRVG